MALQDCRALNLPQFTSRAELAYGWAVQRRPPMPLCCIGLCHALCLPWSYTRSVLTCMATGRITNAFTTEVPAPHGPSALAGLPWAAETSSA